MPLQQLPTSSLSVAPLHACGAAPRPPKLWEGCARGFPGQVGALGQPRSRHPHSSSHPPGEHAGRRGALAGALAALLVAAPRGGGGRGDHAARAEEPSKRQNLSEAAQRLTDQEKKRIDEIFRSAISAETVQEEEEFWTQLVDAYGDVPEVIIRAATNRGNSRLRQGKFEEALGDYNRAIEISPYEVDPFLNRGIVFEATGRLEDALKDYDRVLGLNPEDPAGWNNRGNALLGMRRFKEASQSFKSALGISGPQKYPNAAVNLNLAEYELGNDAAVIKDLESLLRRFADDIPDARAAYALMIWEAGDRVAGEREWDRATATDPRYRQLDWVTKFRRWPPRLTGILQRFSDSSNVKAK